MTSLRRRPLARMNLRRWPDFVLGLLMVGTATGASTQTLALKADAPSFSFLCDPATEDRRTTGESPPEVQRMVDAATQAMILGDLAVAADFLDRALEADPSAAEAIYLRGRIAAEGESAAAGIEWFCAYLSVAPDGALASEATRGLEQAMEEGAGADLQASFREGVASFESEPARSEEIFTSVLDRHLVPEALYDRGLVRLALERREGARADLTRYLELRPGTDQRVAIQNVLEALDRDRRSPGSTATFLLGTLIPGAGQYYTGRTGLGMLVTGLVAGTMATGYLYERTTIHCRAPSPSGGCPPEAVAARETERPLLGPALGVGVGVMLISAIEAALHARGQTAALTVPLNADHSLRLDLTPRPLPSAGSPAIQIRILY